MGRHAKPVDNASRASRASALVVVWLGGLAAGLFGLLSVSARYTTCGAHSHGLACRTPGTALGGFLVVGVIGSVSATTVLTHDRPARTVVLWALAGVAVQVACYLGAHALLGTA